MLRILILSILTICLQVHGYHHHHHHQHDPNNHDRNDNDGKNDKLTEVFSWKQISYDIDGKIYNVDANSETTDQQKGTDIPDIDKFFIQYNNVPIGLEVWNEKVFVTVPRRRYGIPSTLNYVEIDKNTNSPNLKPYPNNVESKKLVSVYRPRVDRCDRLWMVDTGLLEVPGERKQLQTPSIVIYDLKTNTEILKYNLKPTDLVNERTPAGLTSITVDVSPQDCSNAFAYITDLATNGVVVFSLESKDSWRINHESFVHDPSALNFTVAGNVINWPDGIFSLALSDPDSHGHRKAFYHPLASTKEFSIDTRDLKNNNGKLDSKDVQILGEKGQNSQSGSHDYHSKTRILVYANVARDAISCWNTRKPLTPENISVLAQDHEKLVYISDLKVVGDNVWVLVNQIPVFVYSRFDTNKFNFFILRGKIQELIKGTPCDQ